MFRVIEPSSPEQFEKIFSLRYAILRAPWNQHRGSERDDGEETAMHAMIVDESGNCIATGRLQLNSPEEAQIRFMAVDEKHRGKKLGKMILDFLENKAKEKKCSRIILQARENAVDFYKARGYNVEEKTFLLFDSIQHFRMSRKLF